MPLPTRPLATVKQYARAIYRASFQGRGMGERQFLGQLSRASSLVAWSAQKGVEDVDLDIVPTAQSSLDSLSGWAFLLGLPNGGGGYGPLVATPASGGVGNFTGVGGTAYAGATAVAPDGQTQVQVVGTPTIAGSPPSLGSVSGSLVALTAGFKGNIAAGTTMTWSPAPAGSDPTFVLTSPLVGGIDGETGAQIYARILSRLQNPPRGGTSADFALWCELVATITGVYVYGKRSGTGTVDVVVTISGSGVGRIPANTVVQLVQTMVDSLRPVACDGVSILAAFTAAAGHVVRARVVPNGVVNAFDWGSDQSWVGTPFTVDLYTPGTPATLRLNTLAPATLKTAIQAYINHTGPQPRLQVLSTGSVINGPVGTSPTVTWSDAGGKTTITLDTIPAGWTAPTTGDTVYPYGPVVASIAAGELALCDALGPSRVTGYGDNLSPWSDTLSINQIARVAEDATDASGVPLVTEVIAGGATIDGSSAADLEAADATPNQAPELLYLSHVAVTP